MIVVLLLPLLAAWHLDGLRYGMMFKGIPERPEFVAYAGRMAERPAAKRATQKDKELAAAAG